MQIIRQYITCEGRYSLVLAFHIRLLMVFEGKALNLPYFLLRSLTKMSRAYQRTSNVQSLFHHGLIYMILEHELVKYHISWERFLSKIQLDDDKHLRNYSNDGKKNSLSSDLKDSHKDESVEPQNNMEISENREQSSPDLHESDKIDIDVVNFANKRNARVSSRITRNQSKKKTSPEYVDLDEVNTPTSFAAQVMLDLKNQPPTSSPVPSEEVVPDSSHIPESDNGECKTVECQSCLDYKEQVQNLKDDISELHKEILKLRRQKRLITENYELEIAELNKKLKKNEPDHRYNSSSISIIINSEGQSASKSKEN